MAAADHLSAKGWISLLSGFSVSITRSFVEAERCVFLVGMFGHVARWAALIREQGGERCGTDFVRFI